MLRGQAGTATHMRDIWPEGSFVVVMDGRPEQITIPSASRGLERHYRYGPAKQAVSAASFKHVVQAFKGNGYRPYPVTHLTSQTSGATHQFSWIRATRVDGDVWGTGDVPLGEDTEVYQVTITQAGQIKRQQSLTSPLFSYSAAAQTSELQSGDYQIAVAQMSTRFGPGPSQTLTLPSLV